MDTDGLRQPRLTVLAASEGVVENGEGSWPLWLFGLVDDVRATRDAELLAVPPTDGLPERLRALFASAVERLCLELGWDFPAWCGDAGPLKDPWFVSGIENLKATALVESPACFRRRNLFVLGNFMDRA